MHDIASNHGLSIRMYADDTKIDIEFDVSALSATATKSRLEACVLDISSWLHENKLQLNEDKTELVMITPSQQAGKVDIESVQVGGCDIKPASFACNLGATFDQHMTLKPHKCSYVKSCYWERPKK